MIFGNSADLLLTMVIATIEKSCCKNNKIIRTKTPIYIGIFVRLFRDELVWGDGAHKFAHPLTHTN